MDCKIFNTWTLLKSSARQMKMNPLNMLRALFKWPVLYGLHDQICDQSLLISAAMVNLNKSVMSCLFENKTESEEYTNLWKSFIFCIVHVLDVHFIHFCWNGFDMKLLTVVSRYWKHYFMLILFLRPLVCTLYDR